jgi:UDP-4-amino-4-deoxy-L-arabinose-oxoglutarate aminotransferase
MSAGAADRFKTGSYAHWNMDFLGIKANLPDILASLLPSQIANADSKLKVRRSLAERYDEAFSDSPLRTPRRNHTDIHALHLYPIWVPFGLRDSALKLLSENRIGATVNFRPVNEMNYYIKKYGGGLTQTPISSSWGAGVLSLPLYPGLSWASQDYVIKIIQNVIFDLISKAKSID